MYEFQMSQIIYFCFVFVRTISVAEFPGHFSQLSVDSNRGFGQEYEVHSKIYIHFVPPLPLLPVSV